jgi:hypothetical protein
MHRQTDRQTDRHTVSQSNRQTVRTDRRFGMQLVEVLHRYPPFDVAHRISFAATEKRRKEGKTMRGTSETRLILICMMKKIRKKATTKNKESTTRGKISTACIICYVCRRTCREKWRCTEFGTVGGTCTR